MKWINILQASNGWLAGFKSRHGIRKLQIKGEKSSADTTAANSFINRFTEDVALGGYHAQNIYNADETGMFWKLLPDSTLALANEKQAFGSKLSKERITLLFCANSTGTHKIDVLAIGKAARPRGFPANADLIPVKYRHSKKAWMTREIFEWWYDNVFIPQVEEE